MITSAKQLNASKAKLAMLKDSLKAKPAKDIPAEFLSGARAQTEQLISEIENEIAQYETLQTKGLSGIELRSLEEMMLFPIQFRIAKHLTQDEFAKFVDVPLRQICRYEQSEYQNITGDTLRKILHKLTEAINFSSQISERKRA